MGRVYKNYNIVGDMLLKPMINETKHLLWRAGGVPSLDAEVWDEYYTRTNKIKKIRIQTNKGRVFKIDAIIFDKNKEEINYPLCGRQHYCNKEFWVIDDLVKKYDK